MKTVILPAAEINLRAAEQIRELISAKNDAVLAFDCGKDFEGLFAELIRLYESGSLSFQNAMFFTLCEYEDMEADDCRSRAHRFRSLLLNNTDARAENCFFLCGEIAAEYDAMIAGCGGLDMAVLGVGSNGRIGFNEPGTPFESLTHRQKLTDRTKRELADVFGGEENVPPYGLTMGIKTIISAGQIITLSFGSEKADAVFNMLYARNDSYVPSAFLQIPLNVTVYCDEQGAEKL